MGAGVKGEEVQYELVGGWDHGQIMSVCVCVRTNIVANIFKSDFTLK